MKKILVYLSDGYADYEQAYVCSKLNQNKNFKVETIANNTQVKSMSGLNVIVDYTLCNSFDISEYEMLILVGGLYWKSINYKDDKLSYLCDNFLAQNKMLAGICDATTFMANNGYFNNRKHTANTLEYLEEYAPNYNGKTNYIEAQCVSDKNVISANGSASLEFARDILYILQAEDNNYLDAWYNMMKKGFCNK